MSYLRKSVHDRVSPSAKRHRKNIPRWINLENGRSSDSIGKSENQTEFKVPVYFKAKTEVKPYEPVGLPIQVITRSVTRSQEAVERSEEDSEAEKPPQTDGTEAQERLPEKPSNEEKKKKGEKKRKKSKKPKASRDTEDWMFDRTLFHELEQEYGPFTLDEAANVNGDNAQCRRFCSKDDSFIGRKVSLKGETIWANFPYESAGDFLEHYFAEKERLRTAALQQCLFYLNGRQPIGGAK